MPTLDDALALARSGWEVLPLRGKLPASPHGVLDATANEEQIARWWYPGRNWNVGARVPEHLIVLDVDPQNGGDFLELEHAAGTSLPTTLTVVSGRGTGGEHRYFQRPPGDLSSTRLPAGIDLKTHRGYCVMPPSLHPSTGRPYTWLVNPLSALPEPISALLRVRQHREHQRPDRAPNEPRARALARFVETRTEGQRNAGLFWAACRAAEDHLPESAYDLLRAAAAACGLDPREAERTIASARRRFGRA